tara:strand:- start:250 stop:462 length:213 start_codon:yes stop_codon:yes gene_type:complete
MDNNSKKISFFHFDYNEFFFGPEKWILNPISLNFKNMKKVPVYLNIYDENNNISDTKIKAWAFGEYIKKK